MKNTHIAVVTAAVVAAVIAALTGCAPAGDPVASRAPTAAPTPSATPTAAPLPADLSTSQIASLPASVYDAVIPGLLTAPTEQRHTAAMTVDFDTAVYGDDFVTPVAHIPARDFLDQPTVVVPVAERGDWSLVLTAARRMLPSQAGSAGAAAQTAAWVPTPKLVTLGEIPNRIVVSVSAQTLTITDAEGHETRGFAVGVGTPDTPTPTGVTGYLQARYLDPAQGQETHRIQLTSLHATGADEPYGGSDGGLIGIHYQQSATGAVSHGCLRLTADAIAAVDALALGTPVQITD